MSELSVVGCPNCEFWDARDEERLDGLCRYFPPSLAGQIAPHGNAIFQSPEAAVWPITRREDWCGRFQHNMTLNDAKEFSA